MIHRSILTSLAFAGLVQPAAAMDLKARLDLEPLIVQHAKANNVPASLVHRIIIRESRYNARAVGRGGALGLMQIKHATARALGYSGAPAGLLEADTNLTYGVRYLAGAYRVADGDPNRAVGFYARGYYYDAKRRGMLGTLAKAAPAAEEPVAVAAPQPQQPQSIFSLLFSPPRQPAPQAPQATVEEAEAPVPSPRSKRPSRQQAAADATMQKASVLSEPAQDPNAPSVASDTRRNRAGARAPSGDGITRSEAPAAAGSPQGAAPASGAVEASAFTRSGRPARRTAASDADRSAQKASAQPGDPGRHP